MNRVPFLTIPKLGMTFGPFKGPLMRHTVKDTWGCFEVDAGKLEKDGLQQRVVGFLADSLDKAPIPTLEISLSRTYMKQHLLYK